MSIAPVTKQSQRESVALVAALLAAQAVAAPPTITDLGVLPGFTTSTAFGVSGDGSVVIGQCGPSSSGLAFVWTPVGGMQSIPLLPGTAFSGFGGGISDDGVVVVGWASGGAAGSLPFKWTQSSGTVELPTPGVNGGGARAASADGAVIVGHEGDFHPCMWLGGSIYSELEAPPGLPWCDVIGVSANGEIAVGEARVDGISSGTAALWGPTGVQLLQPLPGHLHSLASGVSRNGLVAVGYSQDSQFGLQGVRWVQSGGPQPLGVLPGAPDSFARRTNADGSLVGGVAFDAAAPSTPNRAFLWSSSLGMMDLRTFLASRGSDVTEWTAFSNTGAVSADGRSIVGSGVHLGQTRAFLVTGIVICPGDASGDGVINFVDLNLVLSQFGQSGLGLSGDINADGVVNFPDLNFVLSAFGESC